ncbi:hypothetical protein [Bowmanella denitrificans]|nr:hypothetical protein [Bowmanella denitrificans]
MADAIRSGRYVSVKPGMMALSVGAFLLCQTLYQYRRVPRLSRWD